MRTKYIDDLKVGESSQKVMKNIAQRWGRGGATGEGVGRSSVWLG